MEEGGEIKRGRGRQEQRGARKRRISGAAIRKEGKEGGRREKEGGEGGGRGGLRRSFVSLALIRSFSRRLESLQSHSP